MTGCRAQPGAGAAPTESVTSPSPRPTITVTRSAHVLAAGVADGPAGSQRRGDLALLAGGSSAGDGHACGARHRGRVGRRRRGSAEATGGTPDDAQAGKIAVVVPAARPRSDRRIHRLRLQHDVVQTDGVAELVEKE